MLYHPFAMCLMDTQLTASEVLRAFHRDEPYLFLGSAFTTLGAVSIVIRIGMFAFGILAILDNLIRPLKVEPYGFAVLLASLGYVATRRTLKREEEYGEIQRELELARRIQLSLLPAAFPDSAAFRIAARYVPM